MAEYSHRRVGLLFLICACLFNNGCKFEDPSGGDDRTIVNGSVTDKETGKPIKGATVLFQWTHENNTGFDFDISDRYVATTNSGGKFLILAEMLPATLGYNTLYYKVTATGYNDLVSSTLSSTHNEFILTRK